MWSRLAGWASGGGDAEKAAGYRTALLPLLIELDRGLDGITAPAELTTKLHEWRARTQVLGGGVVKLDRAKTEVNRTRDHFHRVTAFADRVRAVSIVSIMPFADVHRDVLAMAESYRAALIDCNWTSQLVVEARVGTRVSAEEAETRRRGDIGDVGFQLERAQRRIGELEKQVDRLGSTLQNLKHRGPETYEALGIADENWRWLGVRVSPELVVLPPTSSRFPNRASP